ncbi:MAG TPA: OmpH family outer membrane protein [Pyrinomonadaceae bacterium]|jgi:Skp family chaperone for outer membrane proteins|nr:OmpH family outer membrane protein [Pyrinomonadaceae bacterium]
MISKKIFLFPIVVTLVAAGAVSAQSTGSVPVGKVAVIFSEAFQDPKIGITKFNVLQTQLNNEFKKQQDDLNAAAQRVQALQDEITKLQKSPTAADPRTVQAKMDQLDQLKKDSQRKLEDAQAAYGKRRTDLLTPLQDDVGKALDKFAKDHGITLIIDGSQVQGLLYAAESMDITKVFITEYNSKNPATSAATTKSQ